MVSDDDEGATKLPEQKEPTSTRGKGAGILDDYFYCDSSENEDVALLQLMDEFESPPKAVKTSSTIQDSDASKSPMKVEFSSETNSSDEELLTSYMKSKSKNLTSVEPSERYNVSQIKTEKTDFNTAYSTSLKDVIDEGGDVMDFDNESDDFALLEASDLPSHPKTKPFSGIQRATVSNSLGKADLPSDNDNSDEEPLSSVAAHRALKSTNVKTSTHDVASKVKNEEIVFESKTASFDEIINTISRDTSTHKADLSKIKTEVECNNSLFAEANEVTGEVEYSMDGNSDPEAENYEIESGGREGDAQPTPTVKPEPAEEGEDRMSLSLISKQLENEYNIDDGMNLWDDYYGYSELVVNSQENALASVEEDLDDLYSTQIANLEENDDTILSSPYANDTAVPDEALSNAKAKKRVTFADESRPADTVASFRPSVSQAAITKPSRALSEDELFHEILNWKAEHLCNLQSNGRPANLPRNFSVDRVPNYFDSMDHYYKIFKPLLFMEIWEQVF